MSCSFRRSESGPFREQVVLRCDGKRSDHHARFALRPTYRLKGLSRSNRLRGGVKVTRAPPETSTMGEGRLNLIEPSRGDQPQATNPQPNTPEHLTTHR
jgi:hypothetical protein